MVRLALVVLVCAACFADMPPVGLGSGSSSAAATTGTSSGATGEAMSTTGDGASGTSAAGTSTTGSTGPAVTSGGTGATDAGTTTAGASTGGDPGTTSGGMTASGTTGPLMWDDCKQFDTRVECIGCCGEVIDASAVYYNAFAACLCMQGNPCMQTCGLDLCFFGMASAACLECAAGPGAACQTTATTKCQNDPDCSAFLDCNAENGCAQKP